MNSIFEVVDNTDDERYFPVGVFPTLAEAVAAVQGHASPWNLCQASLDCDFVRIEVRERAFGLAPLDCGKLVKAWEWARRYDGDLDEFAWNEVEK